jgi:5-methylcytosine-specific restriction protein A
MGSDPFYKSSVWRTIRRQRLELDGYTCQGCGKAGRGPGEPEAATLDVHHRIPRSVDPSRALDVTNTVSLCRKCHGKIDKVNAKPRTKTPTFM